MAVSVPFRLLRTNLFADGYCSLICKKTDISLVLLPIAVILLLSEGTQTKNNVLREPTDKRRLLKIAVADLCVCGEKVIWQRGGIFQGCLELVSAFSSVLC